MAKNPQFTRADIENQAKALKIDPAKIQAIVEALMGFLKFLLPLFMAFKPGDKAAKKFVDSAVHINEHATR